jgi:hypothetical protein
VSETVRPSGANGPESGKARGKGRLVRSCCLYLATATGLLCMIAQWGLAAAVTCAVLGALSGAAVASAFWSRDDGPSEVRRIARVTLAAGLAGPAVIGLVAAFKLTGVLIVVILAGTTPALTSLVRARWFAPEDRPRSQQAGPKVQGPEQEQAPHAVRPVARPMPELRNLDDEALCLAWRRSFLLLDGARSAAERLAVVEQRQQYLDELHRRSPKGLAAWLASGARASGNPLPYVDDARRRAG